MFDVSRFKVVYNQRVLNALDVDCIDMNMNGIFDSNNDPKQCVIKPNFIGVYVINEDGNIEFIHDEAWRFQFIPNIERGK